ncbi:MAG: esterase [Bacteroidaceae bacterium]|nr:esterase [Bacteroidaceae bacterium]
MKKILLALTALMMTASHAESAEPVLDSLKIQGQTRRFWLYKPDGTPQDAPLVFVLHGYGNPGQKKNWMSRAAEKHKFAVCIPHGWKDPKGQPSWNVGYPFQEGWQVDEVAGMEKLARYVQKKYGLSRRNTFMTGMSNGGEMCYLTAYSKQKTFKAVAPVSGLTMEWIYRTMEAPGPMPLFEIHGTADHVSEWNGDLEDKGGWGAYMPVPLAIGYWVAKNRNEQEQVERIASRDTESGRSVVKHKYTGGPTGCEVWLYEVTGGSHSWFEEDIDTGEEIWSFFSKYLE